MNKTMRKKFQKPTIETLINQVALSLTAVGIPMIVSGKYYGFLLVVFSMGLEFFKYYGRKIKLW